MKRVGNWMPIDVHSLSEAAAHNAHIDGVGDPSPFANPDSLNICASYRHFSLLDMIDVFYSVLITDTRHHGYTP